MALPTVAIWNNTEKINLGPHAQKTNIDWAHQQSWYWACFFAPGHKQRKFICSNACYGHHHGWHCDRGQSGGQGSLSTPNLGQSSVQVCCKDRIHQHIQVTITATAIVWPGMPELYIFLLILMISTLYLLGYSACFGLSILLALHARQGKQETDIGASVNGSDHLARCI